MSPTLTCGAQRDTIPNAAPQEKGFTMLSKELNDKWVADLRANPTLQGRNWLQTPEGTFCCMGRLAEVAGIQCNKHKAYNDPSRPEISYIDYIGPHGDTQSGDLPMSFVTQVGMTPAGWLMNPNGDRLRDRDGYTVCLAGLNDNFGLTYSQAADLISHSDGALVASADDLAHVSNWENGQRAKDWDLNPEAVSK